MSARAIWKGNLVLGDHAIALKVYSAVQDQAVHFHLLHARDKVPVEQRIVRKDNGRVVPREEQRKAFPLDDEKAVILQDDELEALEPEPSRDIAVLRFVPATLLDAQWYDRPYFLGPDEEQRDDDDYFALAQALQDKEVVGISRWTMRKKRYLGALGVIGGYLTMSTLRRADQVLSVPEVKPDKSRSPSEAELRLADQLVESISADFEPQLWQNEYRQRLRELIEAKARGEKVKPLPVKPRPKTEDLAESLKASLATARRAA